MSEQTSLNKDTLSREKIVSKINTNFFVEAGAGSGKTTMLVSRMVAMVEAGIPIEKICAITFTKAAAGEFYHRFQKLLTERSNPDHVWEDKGQAGQLKEPDEESRERCAKALKKIDLCFMGTIDSFCSMILSEHPSEAQISSDAGIISDEDAAMFFRQQYVRICEGVYGSALQQQADVFNSFHRNAEEVFVEGVSLLMTNRNVTFHYGDPVHVDIDRDFHAQRAELLTAVKCLAENECYLSTTNEKARAAKEKIADIYRAIRRKWSADFPNVLYNLGVLAGLRVLPEAMSTCGASLGNLFEEGGRARDRSLGIVIGEEGGLVEKLQNLKYTVSMQFLAACVPVLEKAMREKGYMTYFDCLYGLRNMLKADAAKGGKLIRHINERHRSYLIDEFQDTDPLQAEVFFYLASDKPMENWSDCVLRDGSLFIVGDPKQSIYRFRGADVASFLKVKTLFEDQGAILTLSRNFRSTSKLCTYFNRVFRTMLPQETANQSKFEEIPIPDEKDDEFQGIYTYTAYTGKLEEEHPEETDPKQIAKIIERLVGNDSIKIRTEGDKEPRTIRYSDIMVITYGKKKLRPILSLLDELGVPTRVEGQVPFGENEALSEIFKIYAAVAEDDGFYLYAALTSSLIGLTREEIFSYREHGGKLSLYAALEESCTDRAALLVASKIGELKKLHEIARTLSPAALFAKIMDDLKVYETIEAKNLEVVYYTLELLRNAERSGLVVTLEDGSLYIRQLLDGESGEERCLSLNDEKDAVHMANLHKVKGLEAPVVILSGVTMFVNSNSYRIVHGKDGSDGYVFNLPKKDADGNPRGSHFETKRFSEEKELEKEAGAAEGLRLVYVAATRARNVLILSDSIQAGKNGDCHKTAWKPLMEDGLPDIFKTVAENASKTPVKKETADARVLYEEADKTCVLNERSMENETYAVETPSHQHIPSKLSEEQETTVVVVQDGGKDAKMPASETMDMGSPVARKSSISHRFPAHLGTMTHKLMEMLVSAKNNVNTDSAVKEILGEYLTPSMEAYAGDFEKDIKKVAEKMRTGGYAQTNGLAQDLLNTLLNADQVCCEVPFCYKEDTKDGALLWNGVMDVVYRSEGKWHIVDYKTNADGSDLDKKYQAQLEAYIKAFKETTGEDADALTYHIDI